MKKMFLKLKSYLIRIYYSILKRVAPTKNEINIGARKISLDIEHIKAIMDLDKVLDIDEKYKLINEEYIKNRKKINEYKTWYWKLVGFNKPPEEIKKMIEVDSLVDKIMLDKLSLELKLEEKRENERKAPMFKYEDFVKELNNLEDNNIAKDRLERESKIPDDIIKKMKELGVNNIPKGRIDYELKLREDKENIKKNIKKNKN